MSDEQHKEIYRLSSALIEKKSEGFSAATLLYGWELARKARQHSC